MLTLILLWAVFVIVACALLTVAGAVAAIALTPAYPRRGRRRRPHG